MRPDNPNFRPCHRYGMDAVGPGWEKILVDLDHQFVMITGIGTDRHGQIKIRQIKEKFGLLRIYADFQAFDEEKRKQLHAAVGEAENKSTVVCEVCGEPGKPRAGEQFSWVKTFCQDHHLERDTTGVNPLQKFWEERNQEEQVMRPRG